MGIGRISATSRVTRIGGLYRISLFDFYYDDIFLTPNALPLSGSTMLPLPRHPLLLLHVTYAPPPLARLRRYRGHLITMSWVEYNSFLPWVETHNGFTSTQELGHKTHVFLSRNLRKGVFGWVAFFYVTLVKIGPSCIQNPLKKESTKKYNDKIVN